MSGAILAFVWGAMKRSKLRVFFLLLFACGLLHWTMLSAGVPDRASGILAMGDAPGAMGVSLDDRIFAVALGEAPVTLSWLDSANYGGGPFSLELTAEEVRTFAAGEQDGRQLLFVGGSQLDVVRWDTSVIPATAPSVDTAIGFGIDGAMLTSLDWRGEDSHLFALDIHQDVLHLVDFSEASSPQLNLKSEHWPLVLPFEPNDMVRFDQNTLLVVGSDDEGQLIVHVDLSDIDHPELSLVEVEQGAPSIPVAIAAAEEDRAWVLYENGDLWELVKQEGPPPLPARKPMDHDTEPGDDDDSAGDDDDSAGDDDDSAGEPPTSEYFWSYTFFSSEPGGEGVDVLHRVVDGETYLYTASSSSVQICDSDRVLLSAFSLDGPVAGLAASSATDGAIYASVPSMNQVELITAAPFLTLHSVDPTYLPEASDTMEVVFSASMGAAESDVCDYRFAIGGTIHGGGSTIEGAEGQATDGVEVTATLTGGDLQAGANRMWIYCEDADGDSGRVSFAYEYSGLAAPLNFELNPEDQEVVVTWTHDGITDTYVLYLSDASFTDADAPVFCNGDASICSPYLVDVINPVGDDDDSADAGDDDDSGDSSDSVSEGDEVSVTVDGLTNGTTYYFALAALDEHDSEGPRTDVLSATPSVLGGAAALAGDTGGCSCNSSVPADGGLPVLLLVGLLVSRRRRLSGAH